MVCYTDVLSSKKVDEGFLCVLDLINVGSKF